MQERHQVFVVGGSIVFCRRVEQAFGKLKRHRQDKRDRRTCCKGDGDEESQGRMSNRAVPRHETTSIHRLLGHLRNFTCHRQGRYRSASPTGLQKVSYVKEAQDREQTRQDAVSSCRHRAERIIWESVTGRQCPPVRRTPSSTTQATSRTPSSLIHSP